MEQLMNESLPASPAATSKAGPKKTRRRAIAAGVVAAIVVAGGLGMRQLQRPLAMVPSRRVTMSPEAVHFLEASRIPKVPDFAVPMLATRQAILDGQAKFNASEKPFEDAIIDRYHLRLDNVVIAGVPVTIVTPPNLTAGNEKNIALNVHGGGFTMGSARDRTALLMAHDMGIVVYSVDYTLAPQAVYPVARDQSLAVYKALVTEKGASHIVGISSSAGGALMLSMMLEAQEQKLPMIAGLGLFTPGSDLSGDGDSGAGNDGRDVMPLNMARDVVALYYAPGVDPHTPRLSPIYGTYRVTFPPTIMTTGTRDLLLSNSVRLESKLEDAGVRSKLLVTEGMWHGFNWEIDLPEGIRARAAVAHFLNEELKRAS